MVCPSPSVTVTNETKRGRGLADALDVHFLQDRAIILEGVRFLDDTLWTDYAIHCNRDAAMRHAQFGLNDHRLIYPTASFHLLRPLQALEWNSKSYG
jgi:hypothetical protein